MYGESSRLAHVSARSHGLSPRVRGIPAELLDHRRDKWSIPACTGNPLPGAKRCGWSRVYPRVYGESSEEVDVTEELLGLSPRVRGILFEANDVLVGVGSIPACTGNPAQHCPVCAPAGVYPRVYGESYTLTVMRLPPWGLSPRVRGIQRLAPVGESQIGSIPACTGNPWSRPRPGPRARVYPRVYGESSMAMMRWLPIQGLSPRVRGIRPGQ